MAWKEVVGKGQVETFGGCQLRRCIWDIGVGCELFGWGVNCSFVQVTTSLQSTYYSSTRRPFVWLLKPVNLMVIRRCCRLLSRPINFSCSWIDSLRNAIGAVKDQWAAVIWASSIYNLTMAQLPKAKVVPLCELHYPKEIKTQNFERKLIIAFNIYQVKLVHP